jgi:NOL1/NOP2/fmu family ribosome biogenesis protein
MKEQNNLHTIDGLNKMNPKLKILSRKEKEAIIARLQKQFGIKNIKGILIKKGREKIFIYQGSLNEKEIKQLESIIPIERVGIYFGKDVIEEIRLSIEGVHLLQNQITKNIFELNEKQMLEYMHGNELNLKPGKKGFVIMKFKDEFLGCGKASAEKISNFIPKSRRLKIKT